MEPLEALRIFRRRLGSSIGRHVYAFVGEASALEALEGYLERLRTPREGLVLPKAISLNRAVLERIPRTRLETLARREPFLGEAIRRELTQAFRGFLRDYFAENDVLILKDLEVPFRYGVELGLLRGASFDRRHTALLIPGRCRGNSIFAYAWDEREGWEFYPGLISPGEAWEVEPPAQ